MSFIEFVKLHGYGGHACLVKGSNNFYELQPLLISHNYMYDQSQLQLLTFLPTKPRSIT